MVRQHVDFINHIDFESSGSRSELSLLEQLLDLANTTIRCGINLDVIHKTARINLGAAAADTAGVGTNSLITIKSLRNNPRKGGLPSAAGSREQIRVVQPLRV